MPNAETARNIAAAIIAARQSPGETRKYQLLVEPDGHNPGLWLAWQARSGEPALGGGGISMRINRCTGSISNLHHQR